MFKKIIDFLNKSPFFIFLFIRLSGGLGLPNQIQILIPSITNITDKKYIIANFFGQLPGFIMISYLINSLSTGSIESISDINIDKTYLFTIGIIIFIIFIIPLIFKRLYERYIN